MKMNQITLRLNKPTWDRVVELASRNGMSLNDCIRTLVAEGLIFRELTTSKRKGALTWQVSSQVQPETSPDVLP